MSKINLKFIKSTIKVLLGSVGATFLTLGSVGSASVPRYSIVDLGTLPGYDSSISTKLNQLGQVVGYSFREKDWQFRSFLWEKGVIKDIGTLGGEQSIAWDINNSGKVVGLSYTGELDPDGNSIFHAFIRNNNAGMIDITPYAKDTTRSEAINDKNQVIVSQGNQAFVFKNSIETNLCSSLSRGCFAYDINNSGLIVGYSEVTLRQICQLVDKNTTACFDVTARRAHLWKNGTIKNLGTIGDATEEFNWSQAVAINDNGQIVGDANQKCVLWNKDGTITDLGASSSNCVTKGINNKGWVVGWLSTKTSHQETRAFLWRKNQGVQDLNNLIRPNSGWVLNSANSINDAGYITGDGTVNGKNRAFLLIPNHSSK